MFLWPSYKKNSRATLIAASGLAFLICFWSLLPGAHCRAAESGKRIVVSIEDQWAYFLEDGFLVKSHIVSTGTNATPTPTGVFHIYAHDAEYYTGYVIQYYTMFFYSNLGFHSVLYSPSTGSWTGQDTLGQKASHGCIRQTVPDARWAYYWAPDGTQVDIIQGHFTPPPPKPKPANGGTNAMGADQPSTKWYFAEGCTSRGFDEYLIVMNPGPEQANVMIYLFGSDGTSKDVGLSLAGFSRQTIHVNDLVGAMDSICATVASDRPVVAERPMYFDYNGSWDGGHDVVGATAPAKAFYFAEGSCRPGFEPYLCIQNPGSSDADVSITYMKGDGTTDIQNLTVGGSSRSTVIVKDKLGEADDAAHDFSAKVECTNGKQIIAERPVYFNYQEKWSGGHDVIGAVEPAETFYFAEGTCRPGFDSYLCIMNPGSEDAAVTVTYMKGDGTTDTQALNVAKNGRSTVAVKNKLGEGNDPAHDFSCKVECTNGQVIVAERPIYFNYQGKWSGGHDVVGALKPASAFFFAEGSCRPGFDTYFCIQNPGEVNASVTITYLHSDGATNTQTLTVGKNSRSTVNVKDRMGEEDDAAHDFSAKVECTNGQQILCERPIYFNYKRY